MQPFTLLPVYKDYLWGGVRLKEDWNAGAPLERIAESWTLAAHPAGDNRIAGGPCEGMTLSGAARAHPGIVSPRHRAEDPFPVMVKLIDARLPLSVQVHPDDVQAAQSGGLGKTEMWYILDHAPGAFLYLGPGSSLSRGELERAIAEGTLTERLRKVEVHRGGCFFIPAGTLHSIGGGILLAEVQQSSDLTYRVFDYGRLGPDGKPRELHIERALEAARLEPADPTPPGASPEVPVAGGRLRTLAACPQFRAELLHLSGRWEREDAGTFHSLLCLEGRATLRTASASLAALKGASLFVPACAGPFWLEGEGQLLIVSTIYD